MTSSALEMATDMVVARLATYRLSFDQIVRLLQRTHATLMRKKPMEERLGQTTTLGQEDAATLVAL